MSAIKATLQKRRAELLEQLKPLKALEKELQEVDAMLSMYSKPSRGGWEKDGHGPGCRCRECDPSR